MTIYQYQVKYLKNGDWVLDSETFTNIRPAEHRARVVARTMADNGRVLLDAIEITPAQLLERQRDRENLAAFERQMQQASGKLFL
jgi:hypothetical protein